MTDSGQSPPSKPRKKYRRRSKLPSRFSHLNMRERRLGELVASGKLSVAAAMRQAGFSDTSQSIRDSVNKGDIRKLVRWLLDTEGGSPLEAVRVLTGKLEAQETKFFHNPKVLTVKEITLPDGTTTSVPGEPLIQERHVEAHAIQLDAAKTILDLHGAFPDKQEAPPPPAPPKLRVTEQEVTLPDGTKGMQRVVEFGGLTDAKP